MLNQVKSTHSGKQINECKRALLAQSVPGAQKTPTRESRRPTPENALCLLFGILYHPPA
jgi:hypothetical protein